MKKISLLIFVLILTFVGYSQTTIKTKEVKINYTNGYEIFNVCVNNPQINYNKNNEYYWYNKFSGVKSTKGGNGGNLLHGIYKFFDEQGNLRHEENYNLGLKHGNYTKWDSLGDIVTIGKYNKGITVYWKFKDEDCWIEWIGQPLFEGSVKKVYNNFNEIRYIETYLPQFRVHCKKYYESTHKQKEEFTKNWLHKGKDEFYGKYLEYYENGKIYFDGQYSVVAANIAVGDWKFYTTEGKINVIETYKEEIKRWKNNKLKLTGGYILDREKNSWLKTGEWTWYNEDGTIQFTKKYKMGEEL